MYSLLFISNWKNLYFYFLILHIWIICDYGGMLRDRFIPLKNSLMYLPKIEAISRKEILAYITLHKIMQNGNKITCCRFMRWFWRLFHWLRQKMTTSFYFRIFSLLATEKEKQSRDVLGQNTWKLQTLENCRERRKEYIWLDNCDVMKRYMKIVHTTKTSLSPLIHIMSEKSLKSCFV